MEGERAEGVHEGMVVCGKQVKREINRQEKVAVKDKNQRLEGSIKSDIFCLERTRVMR